MATEAHSNAAPVYTHAELNIDRLLRDVEGRLTAMDGVPGGGEGLRREVMDILREAIALERRRLDPDTTVERERERRQLAEELRSALEAVHGSVRADEALDEVLKQLARVVLADFALVAVAEPGGTLRVAAVRGAEARGLVGSLLADPRLDAAQEERRAVRVADAEAEGALALAGLPTLRSWTALPLLLEGDVVGLLVAGRSAQDAFTDDELLRAKAVAFWAAAALVRVRQLEQLRRYATLLEQVVEVDQRALRGEGPDALAPAILDGACRIGAYPGGVLVLQTPRGLVVAATSGDAFAGALGRPAPADLASAATRRLPAAELQDVAEALGVALPGEQIFLVPFATDDGWVGCLALLDPNGESPEDRLLESYASRAAGALRHATLHHGRS
jgi:GAF domain